MLAILIFFAVAIFFIICSMIVANLPCPMKEVKFYNFLQSKAAEDGQEPNQETSTLLIQCDLPNTWPIRKVVTSADIEKDWLNIVFQGEEQLQEISPVLSGPRAEKLQQGLPISLYDNDDRKGHIFYFKATGDHQITLRGFGMLKSKSLNGGDEVGLCWDETRTFLYFLVLNRSQ